LSTYDITGGAARAAYRLHKGLQELGHESSMFVRYRKSDDPKVKIFAAPMDLITRVRRRIRGERIARDFHRYRLTRPSGYERFSDDRVLTGTALVKQLPACDLINLHWIAGFVDFQAFFSAAPRQVPIVWRLADMNAFTGGCHFDHGCERHFAGCGACPQLGSSDTGDLSQQVWRRKESAFGRLDTNRLHIVALNRWMAGVVKRSPLLNRFPLTVIPNGVNTTTFAPRGTRSARETLGLPQEARVILFVADEVSNRRKGFSLLAEALAGLKSVANLFLVSTGRGAADLRSEIPQRHLGQIDDDALLSAAYSAADLYVCPSLQDNQPNTVLESMACGTPVVGFDVGGVPDMVRPGITGLLAPAQDVAGLREAILEMCRSPERRAQMAANCRRIVMDEYRLEDQMRRYAQVYETAIERLAPRPVSAAKTVSVLESS
jgi:glycosyltransferase involved in cell wall biosynthesis